MNHERMAQRTMVMVGAKRDGERAHHPIVGRALLSCQIDLQREDVDAGPHPDHARNFKGFHG